MADDIANFRVVDATATAHDENLKFPYTLVKNYAEFMNTF